MVTKALVVCISFNDYADVQIIITKFEDLPNYLKEYFDDCKISSIKSYVIDPVDIYVDMKGEK